MRIADVAHGEVVRIVGRVSSLVPFAIADDTAQAYIDLDAGTERRLRRPMRLGDRITALGAAVRRAGHVLLIGPLAVCDDVV